MHDVAVLNDVLLAFLAQLARFATALLAAERHVILVACGLGLDEAAFEIRVDDAGGLRCFRPEGDSPGLCLLLAAGEVAMQAQKRICFACQAGKAAFRKPHLFQEHRSILGIHFGEVGFDLCRYGHWCAAVDFGELGCYLVFVDVCHVQDGFHGQQVQIVDGGLLLVGQIQRASAMALVQAVEHLLRGLELGGERLVAAGILLQARQRFLNGGHIGEDELGLYGFHVA